MEIVYSIFIGMIVGKNVGMIHGIGLQCRRDRVSRYFHLFKVPTKLDAGKSSLIWIQWTWKPSPRSIGFDADENGQSRQAQHQIPIHPTL